MITLPFGLSSEWWPWRAQDDAPEFGHGCMFNIGRQPGRDGARVIFHTREGKRDMRFKYRSKIIIVSDVSCVNRQ